jgi:hypothetical protein
MNGVDRGLPVLSQTNGNLAYKKSFTGVLAGLLTQAVVALWFEDLKTLFEDYTPIKYINL